MKNIRFLLSENFHFLVVKFSVYLNRHVFVMDSDSSEVSAKSHLNICSRRIHSVVSNDSISGQRRS